MDALNDVGLLNGMDGLNRSNLLLSLLLLQTADIETCALHIKNDLIGKVDAIVAVIIVDDVIAVLMQLVAQ